MTLDQLAVTYLLDNDQPKLDALARATEILVGTWCPYCEGRREDDISLTQDGEEAVCSVCENYYITKTEAQEVLNDAEIYVELV